MHNLDKVIHCASLLDPKLLNCINFVTGTDPTDAVS